MSKHDELILKILHKDIIQSTNEVLNSLEERSKTSINWHSLYRTLMELTEDGKVEKLKAKAGFFWRKK